MTNNPPVNARPRSEYTDPKTGKQHVHPAQKGISLRDHFAGLVLSGMVTNGYMPATPSNIDTGFSAKDYAVKAYEVADAMLNERNHPENTDKPISGIKDNAQSEAQNP